MKTKIKITVFIILIGMLIVPTFESCQKYPNGPLVSLRTRAARVANTWKVDNYKKNGTDYTSLVTNYTETFTKSGDYSYEWGVISGSGRWEFQNNDKEIRINGIEHQSSQTLTILKLEENEFWYYYIDGNDKKEFHMVSN